MKKQIKAIPQFTSEAEECACWESYDAIGVVANARDVPHQSLIRVRLQEKLHK
jgi:hypothetical protein